MNFYELLLRFDKSVDKLNKNIERLFELKSIEELQKENNLDEQCKNDYFKANGTSSKVIEVPNGVMLQQKKFYNDEETKNLNKALQKRRFEIEKEIRVIYNEISSLGLFDPTSIKLVRVLNEKYTSIEDIQREIDKNL